MNSVRCENPSKEKYLQQALKIALNSVYGITSETFSNYFKDPRKEDFVIKKVIFNNPATIVIWEDGSKTIVKCGKNDIFDKEKGLAMCIAKKALGNNGKYYNEFSKWLPIDFIPKDSDK